MNAHEIPTDQLYRIEAELLSGEKSALPYVQLMLIGVRTLLVMRGELAPADAKIAIQHITNLARVANDRTAESLRVATQAKKPIVEPTTE